MPSNAQIIFTAGSLPEGFCPEDEQARLNGYIAQLSGTLPGTFTAWNVGNTTPTADNQDKPWLRLTTTGAPDRVYTYAAGAWVAPHPIPPGSAGVGNFICMWRGSLADLETYDGGSAGTVTPTSGPFWAEVTEMQNKSPWGVGSIAFTGGTLTVNVRGTAGAIEHALRIDQMPSHNHVGSGYDRILLRDGLATVGTTDNIDPSGSEPNLASSLVMPKTGGDATGTTVPFGLLQPVYGVYFIQRTSRIYYKI